MRGGERIGFFANSLIVPCSRELVSLLSRIDSLFCFLGNSSVNSWIPSVFGTDFRKKRLKSENFPVFSLLGDSGFPGHPEAVVLGRRLKVNVGARIPPDGVESPRQISAQPRSVKGRRLFSCHFGAMFSA